MSLAARSKTLTEILPETAGFQGDAATRVTGISLDSRKIRAGDLFVARTGFRASGSDFIADARQSGASAVVTNDASVKWSEGDTALAYLQNLDKELSAIAGRFYDAPSHRLAVTGVTGTNGKTSCCYWYAWLSNRLGHSCGQIGTLGAGYKDDDQALVSTGMTTPDAVEVQALLAEICDAGATAAVMEVSSHGLDQGRVEDVHFEAAIFTNLTQDHLDYHQDMDSYFAAKALLFKRPELQRAILNKDDHTFDSLSASLSESTERFSYSVKQPSADLYLQELEWTDQGAKVRFGGRWGSADAFIPVVGEYNLANLLAVLAALLSFGIALEDLIAVLPEVPSVPGRMQLVSQPESDSQTGLPRVVVDYAHTPDAVASALKAIRSGVNGKLISVLGCGGDRDQAKRPIMGKFASLYSDECWFTSDNPRSEDPLSIFDDMVAGEALSNVQLETDRALAIQQAIQSASKQDLVLVLGKGHENYQEISGEFYPFSDAEHCKQVLNELSRQRGDQ